jgi:hypothetical protein
MVVDTTVVRAAEDSSDDALRCAAAAAAALLRARATGICVDTAREIVAEYMRNADPKGEPKAGAAFLKWVLTNQANPARCQQIALTRHGDRGYVEFPNDHDLTGFDADDRKFVAVALTADAVLSVSIDTDYWEFQQPLERNGLRLNLVCERDLAGVAERKGIARRE